MESWDEKKFSLQAQTLSAMFYGISGTRLDDSVGFQKSFFSVKKDYTYTYI